MDTPQDIRFFPWTRRRSDAWTTATFRAPVIAFMRAFAEDFNWVAPLDWEVTERFTSTVAEARGLGVSTIEARVARRPPVQPAELDDFQQRTGIRILILAVIRTEDRRRFEVTLSFPLGPSTSDAELVALLAQARTTLQAENARFPVVRPPCP